MTRQTSSIKIKELANSPACIEIFNAVKKLVADRRYEITGKWPMLPRNYYQRKNSTLLSIQYDGAEYEIKLMRKPYNQKAPVAIRPPNVGEGAFIFIDQQTPVSRREKILIGAVAEAVFKREFPEISEFYARYVAKYLLSSKKDSLKKNIKKTHGDDGSKSNVGYSHKVLGLESCIDPLKRDGIAQVPEKMKQMVNSCVFLARRSTLVDDPQDSGFVSFLEDLKRKKANYLVARLVPDGTKFIKYGIFVDKEGRECPEIWERHTVRALRAGLNYGLRHREYTFDQN